MTETPEFSLLQNPWKTQERAVSKLQENPESILSFYGTTHTVDEMITFIWTGKSIGMTYIRDQAEKWEKRQPQKQFERANAPYAKSEASYRIKTIIQAPEEGLPKEEPKEEFVELGPAVRASIAKNWKKLMKIVRPG